MTAMIRIKTARGEFQALAAGDPAAPCALVLHGFPDIPTTFAPMIGHLAERGFRVLAPWLRGYAPSPCTGPFDLVSLTADVLAIAEQLAPDDRLHFIGHDWGAVITYNACLTAPEQIGSAVTLAVPHPKTFLRALPRTGQALRSWYMAFFQLPGAERLVAARDFAFIDWLWRTWSPDFELPNDQRDALQACLRTSWPAPLLYYRAALRPAHIPPIVRGRPIQTPTLYLHGANDGCIGADVGRGADRYFSGPYRAQVLPDAGHFLAAEQPYDVALRAAAWLAEHALSRPTRPRMQIPTSALD